MKKQNFKLRPVYLMATGSGSGSSDGSGSDGCGSNNGCGCATGCGSGSNDGSGCGSKDPHCMCTDNFTCMMCRGADLDELTIVGSAPVNSAATCRRCGAEYNSNGECPNGCDRTDSYGSYPDYGSKPDYGYGSNTYGSSYDNGGGGNDGNDDGNDDNDDDDNPNDPCAESNIQSQNKAARSFLNDGGLPQMPGTNIGTSLSQLRYNARTKGNEFSYVVDYGDSTYFSENGIVEGNGTNVNVIAGEHAAWIAHTHPKGTHAAPSPQDLIQMYITMQTQVDRSMERAENTWDEKGESDQVLLDGGRIKLQGSVMFASDGSEYVLYVEDQKKVKENLNNPEYRDLLSSNNPNNMFRSGSKFQKEYDDALKYFNKNKKKMNLSDNDAHMYALASVINKFDLGISLMKRNWADADFREQTVVQDAENSNKYYTGDCGKKAQ